MAASTAPNKQSSRWGSLLQQAVAGVESRLDNILADGETAQDQSSGTKEANGEQSARRGAPSAATPARGANALSRNPSTSKAQERLQERLARAMVKKDNATSSTPSSTVPSRVGTPNVTGESPRTSLEISGRASGTFSSEGGSQEPGSGDVPNTSLVPGLSVKPDEDGQSQGLASVVGQSQLSTASELGTSSRQSLDSSTSLAVRSSAEAPYHGGGNQDLDASRAGTSELSALDKTPEEYEALIVQMRSDHEIAELRRQEETHAYIEHIDSLQSKLQYLSKQVVEVARNTASSVDAGSLEKKLAEKDEQVALLMEEGEKLSKAEMKHLLTIKKLRTKAQDTEKLTTEAQRRQALVERETTDLRERLRRSEAAQKLHADGAKTATKVQKELENIRKEHEASDLLVVSLKSQLAQATARAADAEKRAQTDALEAERRLVADLKDDLSNAKIEKELIAERAKAEVADEKAKAEQARERFRAREIELRGEQATLESKMEVLRARAEEVSTGATGDAQAKLLRQIETLQTQYAVASENWQGIEGSLVTRVTSLEKERDELTRKESDIRRKAREVNTKLKRLEEELESARQKTQVAEQDSTEQRARVERLQAKLYSSEAELKEVQAEYDRQKQIWHSETAQRIEEERARWRDEASQISATNSQTRAESPTANNRKGSTSDFLSLQTRRLRPMSVDAPIIPTDRPVSRRGSTQPPRTPDTSTPPLRQDSLASLPQFAIHGGIPETPSIHTVDHDEFFPDHSSPHRTINDMISGSTAGAGPSVQLVERMSAAVRRLESEKATHKEELARLSTQRDEARAEVVSLMREVEQKRASDERVSKLEEEMRGMDERYQTTLEMLGEKSELVEELKADVADVKKIYRELVDSTMT
ncbi:MAG: hypothetical protein M1817_006932 [Caeruleum heppii]|nr:MAG: hypothetical protein M1817_006932 [Caeruleum heppii]